MDRRAESVARFQVTGAEWRGRNSESLRHRADILALFGEQTMKAKTAPTPRTTPKKGAVARSKPVAKPAPKKPAAKPVKAKAVKRIVKAAPAKTKSSATLTKKPGAAVASVKAGTKSKVTSTATKKGTKPPLKAATTLVAPSPASSIQGKGKDKKNKSEKKKREKVVRDSYSIPKSQYAQLKAMRTDLAKTGRIASKSELLRAGLALLFRQSTTAVKELIDALTPAPLGKSAKK